MTTPISVLTNYALTKQKQSFIIKPKMNYLFTVRSLFAMNVIDGVNIRFAVKRREEYFKVTEVKTEIQKKARTVKGVEYLNFSKCYTGTSHSKSILLRPPMPLLQISVPVTFASIISFTTPNNKIGLILSRQKTLRQLDWVHERR